MYMYNSSVLVSTLVVSGTIIEKKPENSKVNKGMPGEIL